MAEVGIEKEPENLEAVGSMKWNKQAGGGRGRNRCERQSALPEVMLGTSSRAKVPLALALVLTGRVTGAADLRRR